MAKDKLSVQDREAAEMGSMSERCTRYAVEVQDSTRMVKVTIPAIVPVFPPCGENYGGNHRRRILAKEWRA